VKTVRLYPSWLGSTSGIPCFTDRGDFF